MNQLAGMFVSPGAVLPCPEQKHNHSLTGCQAHFSGEANPIIGIVKFQEMEPLSKEELLATDGGRLFPIGPPILPILPILILLSGGGGE